jgi:hypothetical protein
MSPAESQSTADTVRVFRSFPTLFAYKYEYRGEQGVVGLTGGGLRDIVKEDPEAWREMKAFSIYKPISFVASLATIFAVGYGIAKDDQTFYYVGAGLLGVQILTDQLANARLRRCVSTFNRNAWR